MEKLSRQKYTQEFREQAVKLVIDQELTIPEATARLLISTKTLSKWLSRPATGNLARWMATAGLSATSKPKSPGSSGNLPKPTWNATS